MLERKGLTLAGLCGVAAPLVALSCVFIAISLSPWFSWSANALSDLGVGEASWVFNFGLMAGGVLTMVHAAGLFLALKGRPMRRVGAAVLFVDAVSMFGIGLFSEAAGIIHFYFSVAFFVLFPISLFLLGAGATVAGHRKFGAFTILIGILAALPWAFGWSAVAIPELLSALAAAVWSVVQGTRLYLGRA